MRLLSLLVAAVFALGLSAPVKAQDERPDLRIAVNALPGTLEGIEHMGNITIRMTYNVFDHLIFRDFLGDGSGKDTGLMPGLAESWSRVDDRTIELKLREGVLFHNGQELTSDDVVFSLSPGRGHGYAAVMPVDNFLGKVSHVIPVDRYTVQIVFKKPDPVIEQRIATYGFFIVPAREYITVGKDNFARNPVGTGPYMLDEWVEGEYIRYKAFDDYWGGKPTAASLTFIAVPEVSARVAGLVSGEYDIVVNIPPDQYATIEGYDDLKMAPIVLDNTHLLVFVNDGPLKDKRIRQAMSLAIDRDLLREALWFDKNMTPNGHQMPSYPLYMADYPEWEYSPEKAKALLGEAGYDNEEIVYRLPLNYYLLSLEAAQAVQQMWQEVGLNVKLEPAENWSQALAPGVHVHPTSNTHFLPDPSGPLAIAHGPTSGIQMNRQYPDRSWPAPARFNELIDTFETKFDTQVRKDAFWEALEIWQDETPATMLYNPLEGYAMRANINWKPYSLYYMDFRPYNLSFE